MFVTQREHDNLKMYYKELIEDYKYEVSRIKIKLDIASDEIKRLNNQAEKPCMYAFEVFGQEENIFIDAERIVHQDSCVKFYDTAGKLVGTVPAGMIIRRWEKDE